MVEWKEISSTGQITRSDVKYAYINNEKYGCVFVPPSAVLPVDCVNADVSLYLKAGDIVHFTAVPQRGKNHCRYVAIKVQISNNNDRYQAPMDISNRQQIVTITLVTETFAYATNDELGGVFVPGSAFHQCEVTKLDSYLTFGDRVIVVVRPQVPRSGCNWIAESATKISDANNPPQTIIADPSMEWPETKNGLLGSLEVNEFFKGFGSVVFISKDKAKVLSYNQTTIICPILTWSGGNNGNNTAEGLDEILVIGEIVYFESVFINGEWRAKNWSAKVHNKTFSESFTQTAICAEQMLLRALKSNLNNFAQEKCPNITAFTELLN